jgi:hypothetical protein
MFLSGTPMRRQRRVRKGGVQAEKQELFTRLIAQGISNSEACRMVGINRRPVRGGGMGGRSGTRPGSLSSIRR